MARRYRNYRRVDSDDDIVNIIISIFGLYAMYLLLLYFTNRAEFWRWTVYGALAVVAIFAIAVAFVKLKAASKERHLQKLTSAVKQAGMEDQVKNFFIRFGMGQDRSKNPWTYRNYKVDWQRFHEMESILRSKGVKLEDNINATYNEGLPSEHELCNSFSYYIQITAKNAEVQKYIADNHLAPDGLSALVNVVNKSVDRNCHS